MRNRNSWLFSRFSTSSLAKEEAIQLVWFGSKLKRHLNLFPQRNVFFGDVVIEVHVFSIFCTFFSFEIKWRNSCHSFLSSYFRRWFKTNFFSCGGQSGRRSLNLKFLSSFFIYIFHLLGLCHGSILFGCCSYLRIMFYNSLIIHLFNIFHIFILFFNFAFFVSSIALRFMNDGGIHLLWAVNLAEKWQIIQVKLHLITHQKSFYILIF